MSADKSNLKTQIGHAAVCCRLTETLLRLADTLFLVPPQLLSQLRRLNEQQRNKHKENKPVSLVSSLLPLQLIYKIICNHRDPATSPFIIDICSAILKNSNPLPNNFLTYYFQSVYSAKLSVHGDY